MRKSVSPTAIAHIAAVQAWGKASYQAVAIAKTKNKINELRLLQAWIDRLVAVLFVAHCLCWVCWKCCFVQNNERELETKRERRDTKL